jgi:hypothetical protein
LNCDDPCNKPEHSKHFEQKQVGALLVHIHLGNK